MPSESPIIAALDLLEGAGVEDFDGRIIRMLSINGLIQSKKAMARPQDLQALPELEMMQEAEAVRQREAAHEEGNT